MLRGGVASHCPANNAKLTRAWQQVGTESDLPLEGYVQSKETLEEHILPRQRWFNAECSPVGGY